MVVHYRDNNVIDRPMHRCFRVADHISRIETSTATLRLPGTLTANAQLKLLTQYFHSLPCG